MAYSEKSSLLSSHVADSIQDASNLQPGSRIVGTDELPPTHQVLGHTLSCKICQAPIDLTDKMSQHVVKCTTCGEASPLQAPPPGKRYIRCPCNCLLVCKVTSRKIACPRENCRRILTLTLQSPAPANVQFRNESTVQLVCGYCNNTFLFTINNRMVARCPHCVNLTSIGPKFKVIRLLLSSILFCLCAASAALMASLVNLGSKWYYVTGFVLLVVAAICCLAIFIRHSRLKVSRIQNATQPPSSTTNVSSRHPSYA